ncbi:MAG: pilus assembly protein PilM [bacterium]|nr:pilus assembly protein PilM [bacterium]
MKLFSRKKKEGPVAVIRPKESIYYFPIKHAFGLDFSDASLKAVEIIHKNGKFLIQSHSFIDLPPNVIYRGEVKNPELLKKTILELLAKARPQPISSKFVISSFPEASVYLRPFEFPAALSEKQVISTLPFEAESEMPIKISEMYTDIRFHRSRENGHHVVFTAAPQVMVDNYISILTAINLKPIVFELDSLALIRSLMQPSDDPIIILDVGAWSSTITIIERETVHGYVSVPIGGSHITQIIAENFKIPFAEAEKQKIVNGVFASMGENKNIMENKLRLFISEIAKAAKFHEQHTGRPVKQLIVSGGTALADDFIVYLRNNTGYVITPGDPLVNKNLSYSDAYSVADKEDFAGRKESFASTVGLAIRGSKNKIVSSGLNLLPQNMRIKYEYWSFQLFFSICALFIALIIFLITVTASYWFSGIEHRNSLINFEKKIFSSTFPAAEFDRFKDEINLANKEIALLKGFDNFRADIIIIVDDLIRTVPVGIKIDDLRVASPTKVGDPAVVQISGVAATRSDILNFEKILRSRSDIINIDAPLTNIDRATNSAFTVTLKVKVVHDEYSQ